MKRLFFLLLSAIYLISCQTTKTSTSVTPHENMKYIYTDPVTGGEVYTIDETKQLSSVTSVCCYDEHSHTTLVVCIRYDDNTQVTTTYFIDDYPRRNFERGTQIAFGDLQSIIKYNIDKKYE